MVEAYGCPPAALADLPTLAALLDRIVADLGLTPVGDPRWHQFPTPGGITGLVLLAESHLTVHTWPEHGSLCLNLFCCTPRPTWDFAAGLAELVGATEVAVRVVERNYERTGVSGVSGVATHRPAGGGGGVSGGCYPGVRTRAVADPAATRLFTPLDTPPAAPPGARGQHPTHPIHP